MSADREMFEALLQSFARACAFGDNTLLRVDTAADVLAAYDALHQRCEAAEKDGVRFRDLRDQMTFVESDKVAGIALASVSKRIWFHATDCEDWPLDAVVDAMRATDTKGGAV